MKMSNEDFIRRTFELARRGLGKTWPNPLVGSVIVKDGQIIGEGFHQKYGHDHAELDALKNCTQSAAGATVYVNLEPCCHTNKQTPPCAQRLIQEKISKVVICNLDPNPSVNGKGVDLLRAHGIEVEHGILAAEGERINEVFFHVQRHKRPFIHLKLASTLDGKIALPSGESKWITGPMAREHVHLMRSHHQAVMVGAQTVRQDNPKLNVRLAGFEGAQPWRVVISQSKNLPRDFHLFSDELQGQTLVYSSIEEAMEDLYQRKLHNVFLEGGPNLAGNFLSRGLVNRVSLFLNPSFLGQGLSVLENFQLSSLSLRPRLTQVETSFFGEDILVSGRIDNVSAS